MNAPHSAHVHSPISVFGTVRRIDGRVYGVPFSTAELLLPIDPRDFGVSSASTCGFVVFLRREITDVGVTAGSPSSFVVLLRNETRDVGVLSPSVSTFVLLLIEGRGLAWDGDSVLFSSFGALVISFAGDFLIFRHYWHAFRVRGFTSPQNVHFH